jgi:antiviral helicase SKI2
MLAIVRSERLLASRLSAVARQISSASLAQLPEYHQRVKVRAWGGWRLGPPEGTV